MSIVSSYWWAPTKDITKSEKKGKNQIRGPFTNSAGDKLDNWAGVLFPSGARWCENFDGSRETTRDFI